MSVYAQVRKINLANFNKEKRYSLGKLAKIEHYPIQIVCRIDGERWLVTSRFVTTNKDMNCPVFCDKDKTDIENMENTLALKKLLIAIEQYAEDHPRLTFKRLKEDIIKLVKGEDTFRDKENTIVSYIINNVSPHKRTKSTREKYTTTCTHIRNYDDSVTFDSLTPQWLRDFEHYMRENGSSQATIHMQLRNIRSAFNQAIMEGVTQRESPFKRYNMPRVEQKEHFVLTAQEFADFRDYPVPEHMQRYKDFALLSFYLAGLNPADIVSIKNLQRGRVITKRQKTGVSINIPVCQEAMDIIDRYRGTDFLVNFGDEGEVSTLTTLCDKWLKKMGRREITADSRGVYRVFKYYPMFPELSMYTFRRTFATIAAELDVPTENIALSLGHRVVSPYTITEVYIVRSARKTDLCINTVMNYLRTLKGRPKDVIDAELLNNHFFA